MRRLRSQLGWMTKFYYFDTMDIFDKEIPERATVAFINLDNHYDIQAAFKMGSIRKRIPIIAVSDDNEDTLEYCRLSYHFGTCKYFLKRPFGDDEIALALKLSAEWTQRKRNYGY
jgi:hypothetical protein